MACLGKTWFSSENNFSLNMIGYFPVLCYELTLLQLCGK